MSERVTVTVSGLTGSGKSAIYGEIVTALGALGVPVDHANEKAWRSECNMTGADWDTARDLYRPRVTMVEENISRGKQIVRPHRTKSLFGKIVAAIRARTGSENPHG